METMISRFFQRLGDSFKKESSRAVLVTSFHDLFEQSEGRPYSKQFSFDPRNYCTFNSKVENLISSLKVLVCVGVVFEIKIITGKSLDDQIAQKCHMAMSDRWSTRNIRVKLDKGKCATTPISIDLEILCKLDSWLFENGSEGYHLTEGGMRFLDILSPVLRLSNNTLIKPTPRYEWDDDHARALRRAEDCVKCTYRYLELKA